MSQASSPEERYPPEELLNWSHRQRQVLALIARGKTNPEIAEELKLSLEGAKHHVREVMSKLDIEKREEAGEYWRWRQGLPRRLGRGMRAVAGLGPLRMGIATGVAALALGLVLFAAMQREGDESHEAYYLEHSTGDPDVDSAGLTFRWWVASATRWRVETAQWNGNGTIVTIHGANGEVLWTYEEEQNRLQTFRPLDADRGDVLALLEFDLPAYFAYPGPVRPQVIEELLGEREVDGLTVLAIEEDERNGHPLLRVDTRHTDQDPPLELRTWLDPDLGIVIEQTPLSGDGGRAARTFDRGVEVPASFFDPPGDAGEEVDEVCHEAGAWEAGPARDGWRRETFMDIAWGSVPPGFVSMNRVDGWEIALVGSSPECAIPGEVALADWPRHRLFFPATTYEIALTDDPSTFLTAEEGRVVTIRQHRHEPSTELDIREEDRPVTVGGAEAWGREDERFSHLAWREGDIDFSVSGRGIGLDELVELAEALLDR